MNDILNVNQGVSYDNSITKCEYHSYSPYLNSFNNNDEIRIPIQQQDLYVLPSESVLYIEGALTKNDNTVMADSELTNNSMAFLFEEGRYELNGIEIDKTKNLGITTTLKNLASLNVNESQMLLNSGWSQNGTIKLNKGHFNFCIPLKLIFGFAEDYKKIIMNARHELILIRARSDENAYIVPTTVKDNLKINIFKIQWRMPHVNVEDIAKVSLLKTLNIGRPIQIGFRSWDIYEYPTLPTTTQNTWMIKTSTQIEKPRYIIFAFQTDRKNQKDKDVSKFDHCDLSDIKVHLNSESYPYDDLNIAFNKDRFALLYDMYSKFQQAYYDRNCEPLLERDEYKNNAPIVVIDCRHQNEAIKSGPVDIKLEFKTSSNIPSQTSAYCLLIHDRIVEYNPLTSEVQKRV